MPKKCKDHLGNEFNSIGEMCTYWGINPKSFCFRNKKGWELEKILTTPTVGLKKKCKDHLGNEFKSLNDMCKYWGINAELLLSRLKRTTLEDALTRAIEDRNYGKECRDHLGNKFGSRAEMCRHWHIGISVFYNRIKSGWDLEKALTEDELEPHKKCIDHLGNKFKSVMDMCKYWGVNPSTFNNRIKSGWTLEKALVCNTPLKDHLGNEYKNLTDMCNKWNISLSLFKYREQKGWDLKRILTTPIRKRRGC